VPDSMRAIAVSGVAFIDLTEADFRSEVVLMYRRDAPTMVSEFVDAFVKRLSAGSHRA